MMCELSLQPYACLLCITIIICLPLPSFCSCEPEWISYDVSCYKHVTTPAYWTDARTECLNMGADLVVVKDQKENDFLYENQPTNHVGTNAWLGLTDIVNEGDFVWVDSGEFSNYTNFLDGEPNNSGNEDCIEFRPQGNLYQWNDIPCNSLRIYVCEKSATTTESPSNTTQLPTMPSTYYNSTTSTMANGTNTTDIGVAQIPTTMSRQNSSNQTPSTTSKDATVTSSYTHDPTTSNVPKVSTQTTTKVCSCEAEWISYDVSCYKHVTTPANWTDARTACRDMGADLVVVKDQNENDFLHENHVGNITAWLGRTDIANEGDFVWVDSGEFSNYTNFIDGEPNNAGNGEDCIEFKPQGNLYQWNDIPCNSLLIYVCEKSAMTTESPSNTTQLPTMPSTYYNSTTSTMTNGTNTTDIGVAQIPTTMSSQNSSNQTPSTTSKDAKVTSSSTHEPTTSNVPKVSTQTTTKETTGSVSKEIANLTKNVTEDNVEEAAVGLEEIVEKAEDSGELEPAVIQEVSNALEIIANIESPNENVTDAVIGTVDAILASDSSDLPPETTALILESLEQQISTAATDGQNYTQNEDTLSVQTLSFDSNNLNSDIVFVVYEDENTTEVGPCFGDVCTVNATVQSITLPQTLLSSNDQRTNISFTSYYNPNLFQSSAGHQHLSSVILSATIYNDSLPEVFQEPVKLVFNVPQNFSRENASCVFWNTTLNGFGDWSENGCTLVDTDDEGSITCHCTHLTNFAVLFYPNELPSGVALFLDIVTYIGCGVSIVCLFLIIVTILSIPTLRKRQPQKILVNLCVSLICLYTTFICGVDTATPGTTGCITVAVLLHYFLLTSIAWTAVEAANMYYLFIKIFIAKKSHFVLISSILAWGLPCIPPIVLLSIDTSFYDNTKYCYINTKDLYIFIYTVLIPIGVVIVFNSCIFVFVIRNIYCLRSKVVPKKDLTLKEKKKRIVNAIAISLLLGLTWIFGFLSFEHDVELVFLILFCIFNSFQGLAIFYLFCLRRKECRDAWKARMDVYIPKYSYNLKHSESRPTHDSTNVSMELYSTDPVTKAEQLEFTTS